LGYIPLNPVLNVTIIHIPVIVGAILLGPKPGAFLGFLFGLTSLINATFLRPNPIESPIFSPFFAGGAFKGGWQSLVICFVPRILVGVFAGLLWMLLKRTKIPSVVSLALCGVVGSFTNTILVLGGIYLFFRVPYSAAYGMTVDVLYTTILGIVGFNGVIEAVAAAIITTAVVKIVLTIGKQKGKRSEE
jgi:uncharacterized membrane protein